MYGKALLSELTLFSLRLKQLLLFTFIFLVIGLLNTLTAQVVIKERVSIYPDSAPAVVPNANISGDPNNPVYLRYGGNIILTYIKPGECASDSPLRHRILYEEAYGEVARDHCYEDMANIGPFRQWQKLQFFLKDSTIFGDEIIYYPNDPSASDVIGEYPDHLGFYLWNDPNTIIQPDLLWNIDLHRNDALAALPPPEILAYYGNPFVASEEIEIPADGTVYMMISDVNSTVNVDLYMDTPENKLLLENVRSHFGDIVEFGPKHAGDKLRFYIRSDHTLVSGYHLYPNTYSSATLNYDLSIQFRNLDFEDWTDLLFDDVICSLCLIPDHYGDFPWPMQVQLSPAVVAPGDTADIILRRRNADGSLEAFPDSVNFDVQLMDYYWDYGTIYSPEIGDTSDFFYGIPGGFRFIARDSLDVDSVFVPIMVNTSGGIIAGSAQRPGVGGIIPEDKKRKSIDQNKKTDPPERWIKAKSRYKTNKKTSLPGSQTQNAGSNLVSASLQTTADAEPNDFYSGVGEVLITKEQPVEIMLGETKYFQAKLENDRLQIEELKSPKLNDGIAEDVWGNMPLTILSGGKLGVYYDKKMATIQADTLSPVMNDLPIGLLRVIGRFWDKDSTYKTKLTATYLGRTSTIEIQVTRPDILGEAPHTIIGPDTLGNDVTYNLDSLIIDYAGKEGLLPQIIKGIIKKESRQFHPSYRYEPFADMNEVRANFDSTHRYWIRSETELGSPSIPHHNNLYDALELLDNYPGFKNVWQYYQEKIRLYGRKWYLSQQKKWEKFKKKHTKALVEKGIDSTMAADSAIVLADTSYLDWLRDEIGGKGMKDTPAQTRIAASYGLMQLTYYNGVKAFRGKRWASGYDYPDDSEKFLPEFINIPPIGLRYGIFHFKGQIRKALGKINFYENTWKNGLEEYYWRGLKRYNGAKKYPNPVFEFSNGYLPKTTNTI